MKTGEFLRPSRPELLLLGIVLLAGLVHGLLYVFLMPPWQHYDEPKHFEYAWLVAHNSHLPQPKDSDETLNRAVILSMNRNHFYGQIRDEADLFPAGQPPVIEGYSQLNERPLYYILASIPLRLLTTHQIDSALIAARLVSLTLYLLTILAGWGIARELTRPGNPLRWLLPLTLALLPGFTDLMTAVNNDVAAVAFFSLFLWGVVRLVQRGLSLVNLIWVLATAALAWYSKSTAYVALPLLALVLIFAVFSGPRRRFAWALLGIGLVVGIALSFNWGNAAYWLTGPGQIGPTRFETAQATSGSHAIRVESTSQQKPAAPAQVLQLLPPSVARSIAGKTVTVGAWAWASQPTTASMPVLQVMSADRKTFSKRANLTRQPTFQTFTVALPDGFDRAWLILAAPKPPEQGQISIFYDDLFVIEGEGVEGETPVLKDGDEVLWGGLARQNLLRNPSGEAGWPRVRSWIERWTARAFLDAGNTSPSVALGTLFDWPAAGWYYRETAKNMIRTFWGKFGWGHIPLLGRFSYQALAVVTLLGLFGALILLIRRWRDMPWAALLLLGAALLGVWGLAIFRSSNYLLRPLPVYIPTARYAYPAILPTLLILDAGWWELWSIPSGWLHLPPVVQKAFFPLALLAFDAYAIASILAFYA